MELQAWLSHGYKTLVSRFEETELNERRSKQTGCEETLEFVGARSLEMYAITWKCRLNCSNKSENKIVIEEGPEQ